MTLSDCDKCLLRGGFPISRFLDPGDHEGRIAAAESILKQVGGKKRTVRYDVADKGVPDVVDSEGGLKRYHFWLGPPCELAAT